MASRSKIIPVLCGAVVIACLAAAGALMEPIRRLSEQAEPGSAGSTVMQTNPQTVLLSVLPGGLRSWALNILWMRAETLKSQGQTFDALQMAELVCELQPRFAGAWVYQAWNMTYNISVQYHTPELRWLWVYNGLKLLRDKGIPLNPKSINLYHEIAWIYFHKMGGYTDDMNESYKSRWAALMQSLLAPPAYGDDEALMQEFRDIVAAPLDKDVRFQGLQRFQDEPRRRLMADPNVSAFAARLSACGVGVDDSLLEAYNRWSMDLGLQAVRVWQPQPSTDREKALSADINDPANAPALRRMLAFVRAQVLWNEYRMDPQWMLGLMEKYGPMDWRLVWPPGLYWATYGFHAIQGTPMDSLDRLDVLNTSRVVQYCLKELSWTGRMTYVENPQDPMAPEVRFFYDPRFIDATHREYQRMVERAGKERSEVPQRNVLKDAHINYLIDSIGILYAMGRYEKAQEYLDFIRKRYNKTGEEWDADLEDFILNRLKTEGVPMRFLAENQIKPSLAAAYLFRAAGNDKLSRRALAWAGKIYSNFLVNYSRSRDITPFDEMELEVVQFLLVRPQAIGYYLPLAERSTMYRQLNETQQRKLYDSVAPYLRGQCRAEGLSFEKAFPPPRGYTPPATQPAQ